MSQEAPGDSALDFDCSCAVWATRYVPDDVVCAWCALCGGWLRRPTNATPGQLHRLAFIPQPQAPPLPPSPARGGDRRKHDAARQRDFRAKKRARQADSSAAPGRPGRRSREQCARGHDQSVWWRARPDGSGYCLLCHREDERDRRRRKRETS